MNKTINEIETAFLDNLMEKDWLDEVTKQGCVDKVSKHVQCIGNALLEYYSIMFPYKLSLVSIYDL